MVKRVDSRPVAPPKPQKAPQPARNQVASPKPKPKPAAPLKDGLETGSREEQVRAAAQQKRAQKMAQGLVGQLSLRPGQEVSVEAQVQRPAVNKNIPLPAGAAGAVEATHAQGIKFEGSVKLGKAQAEPGLKNFTTLEVSGSGALFAEASAEGVKKPLSVGGSVAAGVKLTYEAKVTTEQAQSIQQGKLTLPNPFDPQKMPEGTATVLKGEGFVSTQFEGAYKALGAELGHTRATGLAIGVEKVSANEVRVTAGPYKAVENEALLGLQGGQFALGLNVEQSLEESKVKTVTIDVSKPEGRDAYFRLLTTGKFPDNNAAQGISQSGTIESVKVSGSNNVAVQAGPLSTKFSLGGSEGEQKLTRFADGTSELEATVRYENGKAAILNRTFNKDGKEDVANTHVTLLAGRSSGHTAATLFSAFSKDLDPNKFNEIASGPPRDVQISINNEQARQLSNLARQYLINHRGNVPLEQMPLTPMRQLAEAGTAEGMAKLFAKSDPGQVGADLLTLRRYFHEQKPVAGYLTLHVSP